MPVVGSPSNPFSIQWATRGLLFRSLSSLSLRHFPVPMAAKMNGVPYNPTSDLVAMAFVRPNTKPTSGDWQDATWRTDTAIVSRPAYYAECLVGPGGTITLAPGDYSVWVKITDNPEIPVIEAGSLTIE